VLPVNDEETDNALEADLRNFYKVEKWTQAEARRIAVNIAKLPDLLLDKPGIVEKDAANDWAVYS
jgi:hypothetical protein